MLALLICMLAAGIINQELGAKRQADEFLLDLIFSTRKSTSSSEMRYKQIIWLNNTNTNLISFSSSTKWINKTNIRTNRILIHLNSKVRPNEGVSTELRVNDEFVALGAPAVLRCRLTGSGADSGERAEQQLVSQSRQLEWLASEPLAIGAGSAGGPSLQVLASVGASYNAATKAGKCLIVLIRLFSPLLCASLLSPSVLITNQQHNRCLA